MKLDLDDIIRVADHAGDLGFTNSTDLAIQALEEVKAACPKLPAPAEVADAVLPVLLTVKRREAVGSVADEAANRVGVQGEEEGDEEVVSVPKGLEGLLSDSVVGCRVHQKHAKEHDMAGDTARLGVVNLDCRYGSDLCLFNVVETVARLALSWYSQCFVADTHLT